jgi:hypothetical protein
VFLAAKLYVSLPLSNGVSIIRIIIRDATNTSITRPKGWGRRGLQPMHYDQAVLYLLVQVTPEASVTDLKEKIY